ncbi:MAG TPA: asparagine synthase (glutamine-hydrolyzing), partial [Polyangia bacterium]
MCGIVAILRLGERPLPTADVLDGMAASLAHRGPDGFGTFADEDVLLAAVRLAVVGVDGGRQPVAGCTPALACVYNGELYNQPELRAELGARGHVIADGCDSSLVPHLYEEHGAALVERMRGMFALALWDARRRELLLARDRLGIKPLFYARTRDFLIVGSEIKAIFASGLIERAVDRDALDDLFSLGYPCPPRTMFAGVDELRPAHLLVAHARGEVAAPRRYWRAPFVARGAHSKRGAGVLAGELRERLSDAVRTHLVADVPVAAALSGGLDSSTIAALAKELSGRAPATFSIGFDDPRFDESAHARLMSRWLGGEAHEIHAGQEAAARLPEMIWHTELPLIMPGAIGGLLLSERQRAAGVRVALTGDGADELLGGYDVFRAEKVRRALDGSPLRFARPWLFRAIAR